MVGTGLCLCTGDTLRADGVGASLMNDHMGGRDTMFCVVDVVVLGCICLQRSAQAVSTQRVAYCLQC